jgi:murein DD-endopeptidase MepM/ murein hydrolase activator NlpD
MFGGKLLQADSSTPLRSARNDRHVERSTRSVRSRNIPLLFFFFLFVSILAKAQDTLVPESDTIVQEIVIPANELYQNTFSFEHIRHQRLEHSDTTELELIIPETPEFSMPVRDFTVISPYGMRGSRMHTGIDLKQTPNDTIFAVFDGMIRMAKPYSDYGNLIVIRHPNGLETVYSHLSELFVETFQTVKSGEAIGLAGRTGRATTEHLHFEIRFLYEHFDPEFLIDFENETLRMEKIMFINGRLPVDVEISEDEDVVEIDE